MIVGSRATNGPATEMGLRRLKPPVAGTLGNSNSSRAEYFGSHGERAFTGIIVNREILDSRLSCDGLRGDLRY